MKFGKLTAVRFSHIQYRPTYQYTMWLFKCDCGVEKAIRSSSVFSGGTASCGTCCGTRGRIVPLHPELKGQRFGHLVFLEWAGMLKTGKQGHSAWWVQCDCGVKKVMPEMNIVNNRSRSCGCGVWLSQVSHGMSKTRFYHIYAQQKKTLAKLGIAWPWKNPHEGILYLLESWEAANQTGKPKNYLALANPGTPFTADSLITWVSSAKEQQESFNLEVKSRAFHYEVDGMSLPLHEWAAILGITRQRAHQLFQADRLFRRVREAIQPLLCHENPITHIQDNEATPPNSPQAPT